MTPEQREELATHVEALAPAHDRSCFGKQSDFDHYAEGHEYARKAAAECVRKFGAQVESLTVPQAHIIEADYPHEGTQAVRVFADKADAETFAAALNAYQQTEPRTLSTTAEHRQWVAAHPAPAFVGADGFEIVTVPFGLPAMPGEKEDES